MTKTKVMEYHSKKKPKMREPSRALMRSLKELRDSITQKLNRKKCMLFLRLQIILILTQ